MSEVNKKQRRRGGAWILILLLIGFVMLLRYLVRGKNIALFNPQGLIAQQQHSLMMFVVTVLFCLAIPTLTILFFTVWRYRESNPKAKPAPETRRSKYFAVSLWMIPLAALLLLVSVMWPATHRLAPQNAINNGAKPLTIQVISLRWKWLFLYPEQGIATVNFVQLPVDTPVTFEMTADETPMSSFWVPNLAGQLYTMTGHVNRLNLLASAPGDYPGKTAEINGAGFAGMNFTVRASSTRDFDDWVQSVKQAPNALDGAGYQSLLTPSENNPVALYSAYGPDLYANVIAKYTGPGEHTH